MNIWEFFVWLFWAYIWISCIVIFFTIFVDVFRDHTLNGWAKALWIIFLVFLPFLGALIYLIARGRSMAERKYADQRSYQAHTDSYIRSVASSSSPADEIGKAKGLLDSGAITPAEFDKLKSAALAG